jgi:hypothetical protein
MIRGAPSGPLLQVISIKCEEESRRTITITNRITSKMKIRSKIHASVPGVLVRP